MSVTKELNFVFEPNEEFLCPICAKVLAEPHVTDCCGQHFCEQCLTKWFREQGGKMICPHCRSTQFTHIRYLPMKRKINELLVYCSNRDQGCRATPNVSSLEKHFSECAFATVKCSYSCGQSLFRKDLTDHTSKKCQNRPTTCIFCQKRDRYYLIVGIQHMKSCPDFPVGCPKNCQNGDVIKRKDLPEHRLQCPLQPVNCPDCRYNLLRQQLSSHLLNSCPKRIVRCAYCQMKMTHDSTHVHEQTCPEYPVICPRQCDLGTQLKRKDLKHHSLVECPLEPRKCNGCLVVIIQKDMNDHCANECPKRPTNCKYCSKSGPYDHITAIHVNECEDFPIGCPRKCSGSNQMKRKNLKSHAEVCPLEIVQCPFSEVGCKPVLVRRDFNNHLKTNLEGHMLKLMSAHSSLVTEHSKLQREHSKLQDEYSGLKLEMSNLQTKHSNIEARLSSMTKRKSSQRGADQLMALSLKIKKDGDKIVLQVPKITKEWTSAPFYVLDGYKMCLVFTTEEERMGKILRLQTRISTRISVQLMKGENDERLKWPIESELRLNINMLMQPSNERGLSSPHYATISPAWSLGMVQKYVLNFFVQLRGNSPINNLGRVVKEIHRELRSESLESSGPWKAEISLSKLPTKSAMMYAY